MGKNVYQFIKDSFFSIIIYLVLIITLFFSSDISNGVKKGVDLILNFIVPSLFVFMILSSCIINSKLSLYLIKPFSFLFTHLFHMPKHLSTITLLSLIGGYPIGAKLLSDSVKQNTLTHKEASIMLAFCINCGPAFLITGVGVKLLNSTTLGIYLYVSQLIACFIIIFLITRRYRFNYNDDSTKKKFSSEIFIDAVVENTKIIVKISAYIIVFSAFFPIISSIFASMDDTFSIIVKGLLEVTNGCNGIFEVSPEYTLLLLTLFTAFGGICVHMQIYSLIKPYKISLKYFYIFRPLYILLSYIFLKIFCLFTPDTANCIAINKDIPKTIFSDSPQAFLFMLLLITILLFFTRKSDRIEI